MKAYFMIANLLLLISSSPVAIAKFSVPECSQATVAEQLDCSTHNLELKEQRLNELGNKNTSDYKIWQLSIMTNCKNAKIDNTLGSNMSDSLECKHNLYDKRILFLEKS